MIGTRVGFRLILTQSDRRQEITVHGRITATSPILEPWRVEEALTEIDQLVNEKLPHLRMHLSMEGPHGE